MTRPVAVGFVPLVDAAAIVIAGALGFDAEEGLDVAPRPQPPDPKPQPPDPQPPDPQPPDPPPDLESRRPW